MIKEKMIVYFDYLDDLRDSKVTNMYDADSYLMDDFLLSREEAIYILKKWMDTFNQTKDVSERATA